MNWNPTKRMRLSGKATAEDVSTERIQRTAVRTIHDEKEKNLLIDLIRRTVARETIT